MSSIYGYIRVSTKEQNEARQLDALASYNIPEKHLYLDKQSGKNFDRPAWGRLMKRLRPGDLLIVKSIDRLGRNYGDILEQWRRITKETGADGKGVQWLPQSSYDRASGSVIASTGPFSVYGVGCWVQNDAGPDGKRKE